MNTMLAFLAGEVNRDKEMMVSDWNTAAKRIIEEGACEARAGLRGDWEWTGDTIFDDGKPVTEDVYLYLASTWAKPELEIDGMVEECYIMASQIPAEWGDDVPKILWPESALAILEGRVVDGAKVVNPRLIEDREAVPG